MNSNTMERNTPVNSNIVSSNNYQPQKENIIEQSNNNKKEVNKQRKGEATPIEVNASTLTSTHQSVNGNTSIVSSRDNK